jgi:two-component system response regulator YesN
MKVLLVEDESIVRRFIKSLINWEANGFMVIGEASNGEEAWHILETESVDIVLTDIRMPLLDGFELIKRINEKNLSCEVVILSSYDEFEYVRTALKLQVSDYVHKATISEEELLSCLNKAKSDWLKHHEQMLVDRSASQQILSRKNIVAANLLNMALDDHPDDHYITLLSESLHNWNEPFYIALAFVSDPSKITKREDGDTILFARDNYWIIAGKKSVKEFVFDWPAVTVVYSERAVSLTEWPVRYSSLKRELEERLQEQDETQSFHSSIREAVVYLQEHYMDEITLEVMSELVHVSPAYFSRLFQKETSKTFTGYLTNLRLNQAKYLLLHTELPVYDIAERVGYRNTRYFLKLFKETVGFTPTEYRGQEEQE